MNEHFHPEFGYFCPTPRFRRDLRVAFVAFTSGAALSAIAVIAVSTGDREVHTASAAGVEHSLVLEAKTRANGKQGYVETSRFKQEAAQSKHEEETKPTHPSTPITATLGSRTAQTTEKLRQARRSVSDNGSLLARVPLGRRESHEEASSTGARTEISDSSQIPLAPRVADTHAHGNGASERTSTIVVRKEESGSGELGRRRTVFWD